MPNYSFKCQACSTEHEAAYAVTDRPDALGCTCGGQALRVIRWAGTAVLRGEGWARHSDRAASNHRKGAQ